MSENKTKKNITVKINNQEYKLLITLGFWKNLSFPKSEATSIYTDANKLYECLKLAIFYGNKTIKGWQYLADMEQEIKDEDLELIEEDPSDLIAKAFYEYLPEEMKKKADEIEEDILKDKDIKKN